MFYDIFRQLASEHGKSVHAATQEIGLSKSTATKWKKTGATPSAETLQKIADYFNVSIDFLLSGDNIEKQKMPSAYAEDNNPEVDEAIRLFKAVSPEHREIVLAALRAAVKAEEQE